MQEFYRQWHGRSKDEALRLAELRLLRDLRAGRVTVATPAGRVRLPEHPFFWAGFVLLGEP
jgi:CHAT domain-containing protein